MRPGRLRTRSFVMGLTAWCALSLAPVVALSPALAATFLLVASALAACATLRFSLLAGAVVAAVSACMFAVTLALLQAPPQEALTPAVLVHSLGEVATALPAMIATVSLTGSVAFAELVSMGLEWDVVLRRTADVRGLDGAGRAQGREPRARIRVIERKEGTTHS